MNLSPRGTAVDRAPRLLPGAIVQLDLSTPGWRHTFSARVVRCEVSDLTGGSGTTYKAGLSFEEPLAAPVPWW